MVSTVERSAAAVILSGGRSPEPKGSVFMSCKGVKGSDAFVPFSCFLSR